jgi:hypothetical protein
MQLSEVEGITTKEINANVTKNQQFKAWIVAEIENEISQLEEMKVISFEEALRRLSARSEAVRTYVGDNLRIGSNYKLRSIRETFIDRSKHAIDYETFTVAKALTIRRVDPEYRRLRTRIDKWIDKWTYLVKKSIIRFETSPDGKRCAVVRLSAKEIGPDGNFHKVFTPKATPIDSDIFRRHVIDIGIKYLNTWGRPGEVEAISKAVQDCSKAGIAA